MIVGQSAVADEDGAPLEVERRDAPAHERRAP